jgi:hypothetical protein
MAKDYFQDIVPPADEPIKRRVRKAAHPHHHEAEMNDDEALDNAQEMDGSDGAPSRSIRNIAAPARAHASRSSYDEEDDALPPQPHRRREGGRSRWVLWGIAFVAIVALGILGLFFFRKTTVTIVPISQSLTFGQNAQNSQYTAYPETTAATGTLAYAVQTLDLEDSEVVPTQGTEHADVKASGNITVYNDYSTSPVKLIKNTRFATPDGLIFRTPADVVVPGRKGSKPGSITVTVVADQAGAQYNVGPVSKLTVPGLQSTPSMYNNIYAQSAQAFAGGFSGDRPAVAAGATNSALSTVRDRLQSQAAAAAQSTASTTVISYTVTYQDEPQTTEAGGGVRLHEKAHIVIAQVRNGALASAILQGVNASGENASLNLLYGRGFGASSMSASSTEAGTSPIQFQLSGSALVVWNVDPAAIAQALAGKPSAAFQTITSNFPGIQEAHARIEPPWKSVFPQNPSDIAVVVQTPNPAQ